MGKWWCSKTCQGDTVERIERWGKPGLESWLGLCSHRVGLILQSGKNISWLLGQRATNNQYIERTPESTSPFFNNNSSMRFSMPAIMNFITKSIRQFEHERLIP